MDLNKKLLLNAFFISQFEYCKLVWMCHNCTKNNKINRLHERCPRLIYNDKKFSFEELLEIVLSLFTLEVLDPCHWILWNISIHFINYHEWNIHTKASKPVFHVPKVRTVNHGSECIRYLGRKIWEIIPTHLKELNTIGKF